MQKPQKGKWTNGYLEPKGYVVQELTQNIGPPWAMSTWT